MEQRLLGAMRERRPEALDALLERYGREVQSVAYLIVRDRADAEDICADTIITAWERGEQLRDPDALRAWVLRIATTKSLNHRRRAGRVVSLHVVPEVGETADRSATSDTRVALLAGLDRLPPRMRAAIVLRYYADLSVDEVAAALDRSPNTIKTQLREALERLRVGFVEAREPRPEVRHA